MKHFEDRIPDESVMRVKERLTRIEEVGIHSTSGQPERTVGLPSFRQPVRVARSKRIVRIVSTLVAVLIMGLLVGSAALLLT